MKIAVIGTVMRDEIHTVRGERRESFGGILYNLLALASLTRSTDRILPYCFLDADHLQSLNKEYFFEFPQISTATMFPSPTGTDENILRYQTSSDREEIMTIRTPELEMKHMLTLLDASAILVNVINGREISLELLGELRSQTEAHVHLDIHNLGKELDEKGKLTPKGLPNWRDWLAQVDTVQANEWEIELLTGTKPTTEEEFRKAALEMLSVRNIKAAAVTIGGKGAIVAHRMADDKKPRILRYPAIDVKEIQDTTGCGDCFSSAFVVGMLRYRNPARAGLLATTLSGLNTQGGGPDTLAAVANGLEANAKKHFPELYVQIAKGWLGEPVDEELSTV